MDDNKKIKSRLFIILLLTLFLTVFSLFQVLIYPQHGMAKAIPVFHVSNRTVPVLWASILGKNVYNIICYVHATRTHTRRTICVFFSTASSLSTRILLEL